MVQTVEEDDDIESSVGQRQRFAPAKEIAFFPLGG